MEQVLSESNIEIPASSKDWDPQRAYAKRLENVMNKGKGGPSKPRRRGKNATGASSDEEASEIENLLEKPAEKENPRPKPRRVTRSNPVIEEDEDDNDDAAAPAAPKPRRPRRKATYRSRSRGGSSAPSTDHEDEQPDQENDHQSDVIDEDQEPEGANQMRGEEAVTPKSSSRKRSRPDDDEEEVETDVRSPSADVETTPVNEVRRKRIRH